MKRHVTKNAARGFGKPGVVAVHFLFVLITGMGCSSKDGEVRTGKDPRDAKRPADLKEEDGKKVEKEPTTLTDEFNTVLRFAMECLDTMNLEKKKSSDCPEPRVLKQRFHDMLKENMRRILRVQEYVMSAAEFVDLYEKMLEREEGLGENDLGAMVRLFNRIAVRHNTARMDIALAIPNGSDDDRGLDPNSFRHRLNTSAGEGVKLYGAWYGKHGGRAGIPIDLKQVKENVFHASAAVLKAGLKETKKKIDGLNCIDSGERCSFLLEQRDALSGKLKNTAAMVWDIASKLPDMENGEKKKWAAELRKAYNELVDARSDVTLK